MIMSVAEFRRFVETDETDEVLEARLQALELSIRAYTNNNFQIRALRAVAVAMSEGNVLLCGSAVPFKVGDTLQISESDMMQDALVTVASVERGTVAVNEDIDDESGVVVTKVKYPQDVKMGVVNLMKWELDNREKVGVASETISRHSVTYYDQSAANTVMGYPVALLGFLKPYKRARFGRGIRA